MAKLRVCDKYRQVDLDRKFDGVCKYFIMLIQDNFVERGAKVYTAPQNGIDKFGIIELPLDCYDDLHTMLEERCVDYVPVLERAKCLADKYNNFIRFEMW